MVFHSFKNVTAFAFTHAHARTRTHRPAAALFSVSISCGSTGSLSPDIMVIRVTARHSKNGSCTRTAGHVHPLPLYKHAHAHARGHRRPREHISSAEPDFGANPSVELRPPAEVTPPTRGCGRILLCVSLRCGRRCGCDVCGLTVRVSAGS